MQTQEPSFTLSLAICHFDPTGEIQALYSCLRLLIAKLSRRDEPQAGFSHPPKRPVSSIGCASVANADAVPSCPLNPSNGNRNSSMHPNRVTLSDRLPAPLSVLNDLQ